MKRGRPRSIRRRKSTIRRTKARRPKQVGAIRARGFTRRRKGR